MRTASRYIKRKMIATVVNRVFETSKTPLIPESPLFMEDYNHVNNRDFNVGCARKQCNGEHLGR